MIGCDSFSCINLLQVLPKGTVIC
uniref:Uncharacterized protein n=1 Tax=Arundo donax TaxID=35708 RepID=A0A0A9BMH4_ARUDO